MLTTLLILAVVITAIILIVENAASTISEAQAALVGFGYASRYELVNGRKLFVSTVIPQWELVKIIGSVVIPMINKWWYSSQYRLENVGEVGLAAHPYYVYRILAQERFWASINEAHAQYQHVQGSKRFISMASNDVMEVASKVFAPKKEKGQLKVLANNTVRTEEEQVAVDLQRSARKEEARRAASVRKLTRKERSLRRGNKNKNQAKGLGSNAGYNASKETGSNPSKKALFNYRVNNGLKRSLSSLSVGRLAYREVAVFAQQQGIEINQAISLVNKARKRTGNYEVEKPQAGNRPEASRVQAVEISVSLGYIERKGNYYAA